MGWDVTAAAGAHSALCGVLAGVVLVLVPLLTMRGAESHTSGVMKLLVIAFILLILAAIVWGGLTGYPRVSELIAAGEERDVAEAQAGRNEIMGGLGAVLMAAGALGVMAGIIESITKVQRSETDRFFKWATVVLSSLSGYEVAYFGFAAANRFGGDVPENVSAIACMALVAVLCASYRRLGGRRSSQELLTALIVFVGIAGGLAVGSYVLIPVGDSLMGPAGVTAWDYVALGLLGASGAAFCAYAVCISWLVSMPDTGLPEEAIEPNHAS